MPVQRAEGCFPVAMLNAARNSISFFMLLIVCMGYGVVRPSLGATMNRVRLLAIIHFSFGVMWVLARMKFHMLMPNAGILSGS